MMRRKIKQCFCIMMAAAVLLGGVQMPVTVKAQEAVEQQEGVSRAAGEEATVATRDEFMKALEDKKKLITVTGLVIIGQEAEASGSMLPVMIPEDTVIQGTSAGKLCARSPIQLEGDGVCFRNIELTFESSTALGSVPHREIFLAGHSLTLDNVNTYLEGAPELGPLGGSEDELLPTVYAGGYMNTGVGNNASLTVKNSNAKTMFQSIYMGHGSGNDNKIPYQGKAELNLDAKAIVRETVDTSCNSQAQINITGKANQLVKAKKFSGNEATTLTVSKVFMEEAEVSSIKNIMLKDKAYLSPAEKTLQNVTLQSGACLDFNEATNAVISGDFTGEESSEQEKGILVLHQQGVLDISGKITGTTQFQTQNRLFPGVLLIGHSYIRTTSNGTDNNFVLVQKKIDQGYSLIYDTGIWKIDGEPNLPQGIGGIDIISAPSKVNLQQIGYIDDETIPDENIYFEIKWYNESGEVFDYTEIIGEDGYGFYDWGYYVIVIQTEYLESDDVNILGETNWSQPVLLMASERHPDKYYLYAADEGAKIGDYTFLFCSASVEDESITIVGDVKELKEKGIIMAEKRVTFYDREIGEPEEPHTHKYQDRITKVSTCIEKGIKTFTCDCGDEYTESLALINHNYKSEVTRQPTCIKEGVRTYICSVCKRNYTEKIAMVKHTEVKDPAKAPTATTPGKTEGSHCSVCGKPIKEQKDIPATGDSDKSEHTHKYTEKRTPATVKSDGKVQQICSVCGSAKSAAVIYKPKKLTLNKTEYSYDGKAKKPSATIKDTKGKSLKAGTDYQVKYAKGCKNPGVYNVTVELRGNYSGKMTGSFTIKPKKTSLKKVTAKSKGMQVSWKKQASQADGYQIQYGTSANFKGKSVKTVTAKKNTTSKKISKLSGKKKYYVRIRTYKTVKVNGKSKKLYSDWSGKKSIKTKK